MSVKAMQNRILSLLFAAITGAILVAAVPARATSDVDADLSYRDTLGLSDRQKIDDEAVPRSLSFKFAGLYDRLMDTAAWLSDSTHFDWSAMPSLGLNVSFQSIDNTTDGEYLDVETNRRLLPGVEESSSDGLSFRIDVTDDHAPLVDPSPRRPDQPLKDHIWLSLSARYDYSERFSLDIGYEHLWVNETTVDRPGGIGNDALGDYRSEMDLIGARLRWFFD